MAGALAGVAVFGELAIIEAILLAIVLAPTDAALLLNTIFLTIGLSVLLHGLTAIPLTRRYAAWFAPHPREETPAFESTPTPEQRPHRWAAGLWHRKRDVGDASDETAS